MLRIVVGAVCLIATGAAFAAPNPLMSEEFDPSANIEDFIQACRVAAKFDTKLKMSEEEEGASLMCISMVVGAASIFAGAEKWTLSDGQTEISICPTGRVQYKAIAAKVVSLWDVGTLSNEATAVVTPGQLVLAAVHDLQPCP